MAYTDDLSRGVVRLAEKNIMICGETLPAEHVLLLEQSGAVYAVVIAKTAETEAAIRVIDAKASQLDTERTPFEVNGEKHLGKFVHRTFLWQATDAFQIKLTAVKERS